MNINTQDQLSQAKIEKESEWNKLKTYVKNNKQSYFLKYLVKTAESSNVEQERFQQLFTSMQSNLFYNKSFLPEQGAINIAAAYIEADKKIRNFDLEIFWKNVCEQNPKLNFPAYEKAEEIRSYIQSNLDSVAKVTHIKMLGIFESWGSWHTKYGQELGLPDFKTEKEMHDYLENGKNQAVIRQMIVKENKTILEKTTRLPPEIENFTGLKELTFSNRKSWVIPKSVYRLKELVNLSLNHSELRKVSKVIGELKNANIRFVGTQLKALPSAIRQLDLNHVIIKDKNVENPLQTLIKV